MKIKTNFLIVSILLLIKLDAQIFSYNLNKYVNIGGTNNILTIDKLNYYYLINQVALDLEEIHNLINQKIYFELQFGTFFPANIINKEYFNTNFYPKLALKINLLNPKIPRISKIKGKIVKLNEITKAHGITITEENQKKLNNIQKEIETYKTKKWFRPSIGIAANIQTKSQYYNSSSFSEIFKNNVIVFIGYDIYDIITVTLGTDFKNIRFGAFFDISTPTLEFVGSFFNGLKELFNLPRSSPYYR